MITWLMSQQYLQRRYRADSFRHFQRPVYYLGRRGWLAVGKSIGEYKQYQEKIEQIAERQIEHILATYDVFLKFLLESDVKRLIGSDDRIWQEAIDFGNVPDGWIQFPGGEAFVEVDLDKERPLVLQQKFQKYVAFKDSGRYNDLFPGCDFKALVITTTEERIESIERRTTSDDIWFCTMDEFMSTSLDHQHWFAYLGFYALPAITKKEV